MAGPIQPRRFEYEGKMVGIENAQEPSRQGWPGHVAAQAFEPPPVRACDPRCRMQGKAARSKAQGRRTHPGGRELIEMGAVRAASTGSSSVRGSATVSVEQAPFGAQADDAARTGLHDLLHGLVGQRRGRNEKRSVLPIVVDPVEHEHVEIEVQGGTAGRWSPNPNVNYHGP